MIILQSDLFEQIIQRYTYVYYVGVTSFQAIKQSFQLSFYC